MLTRERSKLEMSPQEESEDDKPDQKWKQFVNTKSTRKTIDFNAPLRQESYSTLNKRRTLNLMESAAGVITQ